MSSPIIKLPQVPKDLDPELRDYLLNINKILIGKQNEEYADNGKIKSDIDTINGKIKDSIDTINTNFPDNVKAELNATGDAPIYACRAWVNFDGTGTIAIRASGNVSSITDNGVGNYTVNFATAMPDANYSAGGYIRLDTTSSNSGFIRDGNIAISRTVLSNIIRTQAGGGTPIDPEIVAISYFR